MLSPTSLVASPSQQPFVPGHRARTSSVFSLFSNGQGPPASKSAGVGLGLATSTPEEEEVDRNTLKMAKELHGLTHRIIFTHGDLKHHNILVQDGHVTGFLDWESAGWYPEYWEFTTALRFVQRDFWWYNFVLGLGGGRYSNELECERALTSLTSDSYSW